MTPLLKFAGVGLLAIGLWLIVAALLAPKGPVVRRIARYVETIDRDLRVMFIFDRARAIVTGQALALLVIVATQVAVGIPYWYILLGAAVLGPTFIIRRKLAQRAKAIDDQVESLLVGLANGLKSTPSVADAFVSLRSLTAAPLRDEIELAAKELQVGSTLEQALLNLARRSGSARLDTALSAVLIGRQVGGNLPVILEATASALREMARLDGVVRAKTAEGKFQAIVLALVPFVLVAGLLMIDRAYFTPLMSTFAGWCIVLVASLCWVGSLVTARKVLAVNV